MAEATLAAANVRVSPDKARNLGRFLELIDEAGAAGADVLVLPETGLQGYPDFGFSVGDNVAAEQKQYYARKLRNQAEALLFNAGERTPVFDTRVGRVASLAGRSVGELADEFVGELTEGVGGVRCGVIVNVEFDLFGFPGWTTGWLFDLPSDTERVRTLAELAQDGSRDQLFVSHDICMKMQMTTSGGFGYSHLLDAVGQTFEQLTGSRELLLHFGIRNTRRVLCWDKPND